MSGKEEIIEKRTGGLGSSDAAMVAKIGRNGCLSDADRFRIAVMLGLEERKQFYTKATELGNELEELIFEAFQTHNKSLKSNPYYKSETLSEKYGFDIFNHIDYEYETDGLTIWIENKATIENASKTKDKYKYQFAWHLILLEEKAGVMGGLRLSHYDTNNYEKIGFNSEKLSVFILRNMEFDEEKELIFKGLEIISNEIKNGFQYEQKEELEADNLPEKIQDEIIHISNVLKQIAEQEKKIEDFKVKMLDLMQKNSIKSIKNPFFNITVVPESTTTSFDSTKFKKEHPELSEKYQKQSIRKSYIKITNK